MALRQALLAAEFFKWEPVSFGHAIGPAIFTIIAPGFTEEVRDVSLLESLLCYHTPMSRQSTSQW